MMDNFKMYLKHSTNLPQIQSIEETSETSTKSKNNTIHLNHINHNNNNNNNNDNIKYCDNDKDNNVMKILSCECCANNVIRGNQTTQITDFSIKSILGENNPTKTSFSSTTNPATVTSTSSTSNTNFLGNCHDQLQQIRGKPLTSSENVLDLSKCKMLQTYRNSPSLSRYTPSDNQQYLNALNHAYSTGMHGCHPGFWTAAALTHTARKLYDQFGQFGQFLPKMLMNDVSQSLRLPTYPLLSSSPEATPSDIAVNEASESVANTTFSRCKRYFAPLILADNSINPISSHQMQIPMDLHASEDCLQAKSIASELICTQHDCLICLQAYYKNATIPMAWVPYKSNQMNISPIYQQSSSMLMTSAGKCLQKSMSAFNSLNANRIDNDNDNPSVFKTINSNPNLNLNPNSNSILSMVSSNYNKINNINSKTNNTTISHINNNNNNNITINKNIINICSPTTSSNSNSNSEEISYKCRICEKVFGCCQTLQAHEKTHKSPRYECADCGKGFSQLRNYKYHVSVHRGTKEFAAECPECGKTFNDKGYLSSHMKIHRNKKEYECPYCPKSFNQRVAFNMHVRIHTGVKPHKCVECGKKFSRKMLLKQHMRTHSGEKPYQCSVCGKSFADRSNMTLHHRLHSGIKPFNCPICPKAFTKKHHLKTHLNYHTGCKPYVCPHPNCNQSFTQSSNMRTHAKKCQYRPLVMPFEVPKVAMNLSHSKSNEHTENIDSSTTTTSTTSLAKDFLVFPSASEKIPTTAVAAVAAATAATTPAAVATIPKAKVHILSSSSLVSAVQSLTFQSNRQQNGLFSPLRPFG